MKLQGLYTALITPFNNGNVADILVSRNIGFYETGNNTANTFSKDGVKRRIIFIKFQPLVGMVYGHVGTVRMAGKAKLLAAVLHDLGG